MIGRTVTVADILASINYLERPGHGIGTTDDIDHLGNRRIWQRGELLQNQFRIGFSRMERVIRERMTLQSRGSSVITAGSDVIRPGGGSHRASSSVLLRAVPVYGSRTTAG